MDQLKDILKQLIKYRFWIAVGLSAVLPVIAYVAGAGPIQQKAAAEEATIKTAATGVKAYTGGTPVNRQYAEVVTEKTQELVKDVDQSWAKLYDRQKDLLTWPEVVQERFTTWGRQWPKDTDASAVQVAIINYIDAYPKFVTDVYKSFKPFDYVEGTGVVAAPPEEALLKPSQFSESTPPGLGKVWAAQERLWIQRTLLDVVAKVNKDAKGWDTAVVKQINAMEVGNAAAQDQRSLAKAEPLEEAPDIVDPAAPPPPPDAAASASSGGSPAGSGMGGIPGGSSAENAAAVYYIKSDSPAFKILPVQMTVLIDQDHIQDFLIAMENSPMNIQVRDFEMFKPTARVTKPVKGEQLPFGGSGGYFGMQMTPSNAMTGYGGRMMEMSMMMQMAGPGSSGGGGGPMGPAMPARKGVDKRQQAGKSREEQLKDQIAAASKAKASTLHDPYYNVVEVKVYGQARFFNPPPAPEPGTSTAAAPAPDAGAAAKAEPTKADDATKADEPKKADVAEPKTADEAATKKADDAEKKADEPKAETKKADEPKADEPKAETKKADEPAKAADAEKKAEPARAADPAAPK